MKPKNTFAWKNKSIEGGKSWRPSELSWYRSVILAVAGSLLCVAMAQNGAAQNAQDYDSAMAMGNQAYASGQYDDAVKDAGKALNDKPGDPQATKLENDAQYEEYMQAANRAMNDKDYQGAKDKASAALRIRDKDANDLINRANAQLMAENGEKEFSDDMTYANDDLKTSPEKARAWAQEALKLKPNDPDALSLQKEANERAGEDEMLGIFMKNYNVTAAGDEVPVNLNPEVPNYKKSGQTFDSRALEADQEKVTNLRAYYKGKGMLDSERTKDLDLVNRSIPNFLAQ